MCSVAAKRRRYSVADERRHRQKDLPFCLSVCAPGPLLAMPWRAEDMDRKGDGKLSRTLIRMVNSKVALCVDGCSPARSGAADHAAEMLLSPSRLRDAGRSVSEVIDKAAAASWRPRPVPDRFVLRRPDERCLRRTYRGWPARQNSSISPPVAAPVRGWRGAAFCSARF